MEKICMLAVAHYAKDDRIYYKESLALSAAGYEVINLISATSDGKILDMSGEVLNPNGEMEVSINGIKMIGISQEQALVQRFLKKCFRGRFYRNFIAKAVEINADVYHAHEPQSYYLALQIAKRTKCKVVFDAHESWLTGSPKDMFIKGRYLRNLRYLIAANRITAESLKKKNQKIEYEVIYNASIIKSASYEPVKEVIIAHEGSFPFNRGLKLMLDAIKLMVERKLDFKLKIVGEFKGEEKTYFDRFVNEHSLTTYIEVSGWKKYEEIASELMGASIGLILNTPTLNNIYGGPANKLFNYMAMNMCVVSVDLPETTRIVEEHSVGFILKEREAELLADCLQKLITDHNLLEEKRKAAKEAHRKLNWEEESKKLINFYEEHIFPKLIA